jgi:MerR family transcriptional regulator, copper efflux regulator
MRLMKIGMLAQKAGITVDTVRYYERCALLAVPKRGANGYREYGPDAVARLRLIRAAAGVGFSLAELRGLLLRRDAGGVPCGDVVRLARQKAAALRTQERALRAARQRLEVLIGEWERKLERGQPGNRLRFLEALAATMDAPAVTTKAEKGESE